MSLFDRLLGRGRASVTVPVMDGPFLPNQKLETAEVAANLADADNLIAHRGALHASSGVKLMRSRSGQDFEVVEEFRHLISALSSSGEALAVGLEGHGVEIRGGEFDGLSVQAHNEGLRCVTAAAWLSERELLVCSGSSVARPHEWRRSLMQLDVSGSVLKVDLKTGATSKIQGDLGWPAGVALSGDRVFVTETSRHRVISTPLTGGAPVLALDGLPAYPARVAAAAAGGYWLSFYSVRNQLVEFILQEPNYRRRMIAEVPEAFWMAPSLSSGHEFKEPMQGSQLKQMGILKPYSASRSYGLVAYCDAQMTPLGSFHSRAGGRRHGTVSCCEFEGSLFVASKGSNAIVRVADPMTALKE